MSIKRLRKKMRRHLKTGLFVIAGVFIVSIFYGLGGEQFGRASHYIARIGHTAITQPSFSQALGETLKRYEQYPFSRPRGVDLIPVEYQTLQGIIQQELLVKEARRRGIKVSSIEVTQQLEKIREKVALSKESFRKLVRQQYGSMAQFRDGVVSDLLLQKLRDDVNAEVRVSEKEIQRNYESVHARHILISFPIPLGKTEEEKKKYREKTRKETFKRAEDLYQKLLHGEDFAKLASLYSDDQGSREKGGDLGWFHRGEMVKPFEKVAFSLKKGEIAKPFATRFGVHILQVLDKKTARGEDYIREKGKVRKDLLDKKRSQHYQKFLEKLKNDPSVEILDPVLKGYDFYQRATEKPKEKKALLQQAVVSFKKALDDKTTPNPNYVYYYLGKSYEALQKKKLALKAYREGFKEGEDPNLAFSIASLLPPKEKKESLTYYQKALKLTGTDIALLQNLKQAFKSLGAEKEAAQAAAELEKQQKDRQKYFQSLAKRQAAQAKVASKEEKKAPKKTAKEARSEVHQITIQAPKKSSKKSP